MRQLRSIHGGPDSHLAIEVMPVRGFGSPDGITACPSEPETAQAYGVYIRNPLALHIQDFGPETVSEERRVSMPEALAAAFTFADVLAEHLGCAVVSPLSRPDTGAPAVAPVPTVDLVEAGACLWEAALEAMQRWEGPTKSQSDGLGSALHAIKEMQGTASLRLRVIGWAEECHRAWEAAGGFERGDAFDWEFVPDWLAGKVATL